MVGCPRSGTTLLNSLLREELKIGFANELQIIDKFYEKIPHYGNLSLDNNFDKLINDILQEPYLQIFQTAYKPLLNNTNTISYDDIKQNLVDRSFAGIIYALLKVTSERLGTEYVGNKHLSMALHLDWLYDMFPNARVIHVVRDGRDCALSLKRLWWGQKNTYTAAVLWKKHISRLNNYAINLDSSRFIEIRYEDFLSDPGKEMSRLHKFVRNSEADEAAIKNYHNISERLKQGNTYKWKTRMTKKDLTVFQAVAGNELALYNYEPYTFEKSPSWLEKAFYILEDRVVREYHYRFKKNN